MMGAAKYNDQSKILKALWQQGKVMTVGTSAGSIAQAQKNNHIHFQIGNNANPLNVKVGDSTSEKKLLPWTCKDAFDLRMYGTDSKPGCMGKVCQKATDYPPTGLGERYRGYGLTPFSVKPHVCSDGKVKEKYFSLKDAYGTADKLKLYEQYAPIPFVAIPDGMIVIMNKAAIGEKIQSRFVSRVTEENLFKPDVSSGSDFKIPFKSSISGGSDFKTPPNDPNDAGKVVVNLLLTGVVVLS
eukprot:Pgem_evm2s13685